MSRMLVRHVLAGSRRQFIRKRPPICHFSTGILPPAITTEDSRQQVEPLPQLPLMQEEESMPQLPIIEAEKPMLLPAAEASEEVYDSDDEETNKSKNADEEPPESTKHQRHLRRKTRQKSRRKTQKEPSKHETSIINGPSTRFGTGTIATLTEASVVGTAGNTVVLSTVAVEEEENNPSSLSESLLSLCNDSMVPLMVVYQERHHGVGKIPFGARRRDNMRATDEEVLASRAIDRALRPLMVKSSGSIHVTCSVQAHDVFSAHAGHPVALALNSASVALSQASLLSTQVAAVYLCMMEDGQIIMDPTLQQVEESVAELLYAGTREHVVMMECSSPTDQIPEATLVNLVKLAHASLEPILDIQEEMIANKEDSEEADDDELRASLGLPPLEESSEEEDTKDTHQEDAQELVEEAYQFCYDTLKDAALNLFGYSGERESVQDAGVFIHSKDEPLLSKAIRGRREHLVYTEIQRLLTNKFEPSRQEFATLLTDPDNEAVVSALARTIHSKLLKAALVDTAMKKCRGDGRGGVDKNGCRVVRPISLTVPALPDVVHGSAIFNRGDTQVLCTTTLGAPVEGIRQQNPYQQTTDPRDTGKDNEPNKEGPYSDLPVGSLRYLQNQEALISDFNSRKVKADREMTGDSGILDEVRRFFLHYDFPSFSTGTVPGKQNMAANRRAIGHGALAEKAVRPTIPPPEVFPYTVRLTSEVTGSNGSSSMATVCGATLALLDAGVPIRNGGVAGVSVGLAMNGDGENPWELLLDITGTEDHYGAMDFKIAGTREGVTALQLDVKQPLPMEVMTEALDLASAGRIAILDQMDQLSEESSLGIISNMTPRSALKDSAPRVAIVRFDPLRKRDLIGPGGAVLRQLEDRYGVSLDLSQEGQCLLFGADRNMVDQARTAVMELVADVEEGEVYEGTVIEIKDFGAIVELLRNKEGLLHVSELGEESGGFNPQGNLGVVNKHLRVGQKIQVLCTAVDPVQGSIRLSRKELLQREQQK